MDHPDILPSSNGTEEVIITDKSKMKWLGTLVELKHFVQSTLVLEGKWSSPGGSCQQFVDDSQSTVIKYYTKSKTIRVQGDENDRIMDILLDFTAEDREITMVKQLKNKNKLSDQETPDNITRAPTANNVTEELTVISSEDKLCHIEEDDDCCQVVTSEDKIMPEIQTRCDQKCTCSCDVITELEGVKLEIAILQSNIQSIKSPTSQEIAKDLVNSKINRLNEELILAKAEYNLQLAELKEHALKNEQRPHVLKKKLK